MNDDVSHEKVRRHVADMVGFIAVAEEVAAKGQESFLDSSNRIDFHAVKSVLIDLNTAADEIGAIDPQFQQRHPNIPWSPLHQMRSKLAHHYEDIQRAILWDTITSELPQLKLRLEELL